MSTLGGDCLDGLCPVGTTHLYACEAGYNMNGSAFTTCLESKLWYPSLENCEPEPWNTDFNKWLPIARLITNSCVNWW